MTSVTPLQNSETFSTPMPKVSEQQLTDSVPTLNSAESPRQDAAGKGHAMNSPDLGQIQKYWNALRTPGEIVELRYPATYTDRKTGKTRACKNTTRCNSPEELAAAVTLLGAGLKYWVNLQRMKQTTPHDKYHALKNPDIETYRWLPIDYDLKRQGEDVSASDAEKDFVRAGADEIVEYFEGLGVLPVVIDSGNGIYVLPPIDLPNTPENVKLITQALEGLKAKFYRELSDGIIAKVDRTASNAARVFGLPGTINPKGANTEERPHRMRLMLRTGSRGTLLTVAQLEEIASWAPKPPRPSSAPDASGTKGPFTFDNVEKLLEAIGKKTEKSEASFDFERANPDPGPGPGWYVRCPRDNKHSTEGEDLDSSTVVWVNERGFAEFRCLHDGADDAPCNQMRWPQFVTEWRAKDLQGDLITKTSRPGFDTGVGFADDAVDFRSLEDKLAEMNERYCYVDEKDIIVRLENMRMFDSSRFRDGGHLANRFHTTQTKRFDSKTGELKLTTKKEKLAKLWLEWPERRQVERVVYEPGKPQFFEDGINRWQGMGVEPIPGPVEPWLELLEKLMPDPALRKWFEKWCAYPLQHLGTKLKSTVVIWSTLQGTGKTTVATTLSRIYGPNATAITESDLRKPFNDWALDKQFISANEITGGDKRNVADFMKELISGHEHLNINQKFLPGISIRNCINFIFTSNHPNSFYLEPSDRRYCIIEVPNMLPGRKFFDNYYTWLDNGGPAHLYHHLLHLPLEGFHPHAEPPMTPAKVDMIEIGKSDLDRWLEEKREREPNALFTIRNMLIEYRNQGGSGQVKDAGAQTALRRLGAVHSPKVSIDGEKLVLWSLNPNIAVYTGTDGERRSAPPGVWTAKYRSQKQPQPRPQSDSIPF